MIRMRRAVLHREIGLCRPPPGAALDFRPRALLQGPLACRVSPSSCPPPPGAACGTLVRQSRCRTLASIAHTR
jgi:hypothetical protein